MTILLVLAICFAACFAAAGMRRSGSPGLPFSALVGSSRPPGNPYPSNWKKGRWQFAR